MGSEMKDLNVVRWQVPTLILSLIVIVGSWVYTFTVPGGFNFGIDFKAGINLTVEMDTIDGETGIRDVLQEFNPQVQTAGTEGNRYIIRIADDQNVENFQKITSDSVLKTLNDTYGKAVIINQEYIQSSFAGALATQTIWLTLVAMGLILLYIGVRFKLNYAISAIMAVFHDVLFLLGFIGVFGLEFSTASIAAILTIIGYSLNDTIVIFDRIRENARIIKDMSFPRSHQPFHNAILKPYNHYLFYDFDCGSGYCVFRIRDHPDVCIESCRRNYCRYLFIHLCGYSNTVGIAQCSSTKSSCRDNKACQYLRQHSNIRHCCPINKSVGTDKTIS